MNSDQLLVRQKELADKIERLLINFKKDGSSRKTPEYLIAKENDLKKYWEEFKEIHEELKSSLDNEHSYFSQDLFSKTQKIFETTLKIIVDTASKPEVTKTPTLPIPTERDIGCRSTANTSVIPNETSNPSSLWNSAQISTPSLAYLEASRLSNFPKLPPMKIPKFNGDYKNWKPFIDMFVNIIHSNPHISDVEKMQYLLYHLEGDARRVISHLQLSSSNYNTALHLIKARYNNNRKIITTYINTIMDAKKVEYRSQQDIIMLHDTLRECLEALNSLKCRTDEWSPIIVCIVMKKLDPESLRLFEEGLSSPREMPTTTELLNFLEKRYQVLDSIKSSKQTKPSTTFNKKAFHSILRNTCAFCNNEHSIFQCTEFRQLNLQERNSFVAKKGLCLNCLSHKKSEKCKSNKTCFYCKKKHHTLLHREPAEGLVKNRNKGGTQAADKNPDVAGQISWKEDDVTTFHNKIKIPNVLLPTAIVRVSNAFGQTEP